jgi:hypothetical protein
MIRRYRRAADPDDLKALRFDGGPLGSSVSQAATLHGLGDLHHPETTQLIQGYLSRNTTISADLRDCALAAARFEVM